MNGYTFREATLSKLPMSPFWIGVYFKGKDFAPCFFLTLVVMNPDIHCLCKQCRSTSVGFWICTICQLVSESILTMWIMESDWLRYINGCGTPLLSQAQKFYDTFPWHIIFCYSWHTRASFEARTRNIWPSSQQSREMKSKCEQKVADSNSDSKAQWLHRCDSIKTQT